MPLYARTLWLLLLLNLNLSLYSQSAPSPLTWLRPEGGERNEYVFFRKEAELGGKPESATLHLYADSRYALYVNEVYVGFGPIRSYHAHPYYDSYDIAPFLRSGKNAIAVQVLSNGMETYQLFDYHGGFTAWGEIDTGAEKISMAITEGWQCRKSAGYDQTAPRFSFATGPIENWDSRGEGDWNAIRTETRGWRPPVPLADQGRWGAFQPRPIPHLTQTDITALRLRGAYPLSDDEDIYSFRIPTPDRNQPEYNSSLTALAYTYLYSPIEQEVEAGLWWGDHFLNGEEIRKSPVQGREDYRRQYILNLRKGWNEFVVRYGIIWGSWDFYIAIPKGRGVELSASKEKGSEGLFFTYGPFGKDGNPEIQAVSLAQGIADIKAKLKKNWVMQRRENDANQPARDLAWYGLDVKKPIRLQPDRYGRLIIPEHDKGIALMYEMAETELGRFFVEGEFPEGTQIDIGFSEELGPDGFPWLYKRFQVGAGLRFIADGRRNRYESFKPYGAKYLHINISKHKGPVTLSKAGMIRQVYPFKTTGSFRCSDPLLNRIWEVGWRTLQLCAEDSYTDTPFRERGLYAGDMLPEAAITMAVSGDMRLAEHSLRVFQDMYREEMLNGEENRHSDFPLITLLTMDWVGQYTQDWSLAEACYDNYASLLRHHISKKNAEGLIPAAQVFIEWSDINKKGAAMGAYQALLVESMGVMSRWAERLGKEEERAFFHQQAEALTQAVNGLLWDKAAGAYFDGRQADTLIRAHHLTSSVWPALYGQAAEDQERDILAFLETELMDIGSRSRGRKITPYSSFYLFALLYREEKAALAEYFLKKHWGPMALHSATPTVWENFDIDGGQGTSSHAWSGHPTFFLATEVLGVNLGFNKPLNPNVVEICPQSATLNWAEGTVAHPTGPVRVKWEVRGGQLWLEYDAPEGVEVKVAPKGRLAQLELQLK